MFASSSLDNQLTTIREALSCLPIELGRFDVFVQKMRYKIITHPEKVSDELLSWLKNIQFEEYEFDKEQTSIFVSILKQVVFMSRMNPDYESFDIFCTVIVQPMIVDHLYFNAAKQTWEEFIFAFEKAQRQDQDTEYVREIPDIIDHAIHGTRR
jgi:hypothetical protein